MATKMNNLVPFTAIHPGEMLQDELVARGMKQKEVASMIGVPASVFNDVIKGRRSMTAELAVLLEEVLGIGAGHWMSLQGQYDIDLANSCKKVIERKKDIEIWNIISQYCAVKVFAKLGIIGSNISDNIKKIYAIFNVRSVEELVISFTAEKEIAYFKKSERIQTDSVNLFSWKHLAYYYSNEESEQGNFDSECLERLVEELNAVFLKNRDTVEGTRLVLNKYGIKFIVLPKFDKTPIDGFSFWKGKNPTIVLTLRMDKIDNYAFALLHEVCHVFKHLLHAKDVGRISIEGVEVDGDEREANDFAKNALIRKDVWNQFMKKHSLISPHGMQSIIRKFAQENKINEAIVFGLYQHDINMYSIKTSFIRNIN